MNREGETGKSNLMRGIALVVLIGSCLCTVLALIPANLFIPENHYLSSRRLAMIEQVRGTIWAGQVLLKARNKETQFLVDWDVKVSCLFSLQLCSSVQMKSAALKGIPSELFADISVPITSFVFNSGCAPLSGFKVSELSGIFSSQFLRLFIPELVSAQQRIHVRNIILDVNLADGVLEEASGGIHLDEGVVRYTVNGRVMSQTIESLRGQIVQPEGYELILEGQSGDPYLGILTDETRERLRFIVYDGFARAFGAPVMRGAAADTPRFEISQKFSDMLCESS